MRSWRQIALLALIAACLCALVAIVFASLAFVLAVVGPLAGLAYFWLHARSALSLWRSHGRIPIADGMRVYPQARTRAVAALHLLAGLGGLSLGLVPTAFFFVSSHLWLVLAASGLFALAVSGTATDKVLAGAKPIDLLPPE